MLDELKNDITRETPASFEPSIDYVVTKIPRFALKISALHATRSPVFVTTPMAKSAFTSRLHIKELTAIIGF